MTFNNKLGLSRRNFLSSAVATGIVAAIPTALVRGATGLKKAVKIGIITDLHHDIMHDGKQRLQTFLNAMKTEHCDALMQMGDFAYPGEKNDDVLALFNNAHKERMHVIGNHDTDAGFTKEQCVSRWGMPARYYSRNVGGILFIVLDGNDKGSPANKGGYPSYINPEQSRWLKEQLGAAKTPVIVVSHQPLAGEAAVDNAEEIQEILGRFSDRILLAINGHTHVNSLLRKKGVTYLHINSASYFWVGSDYPHETYPPEILKDHKWIASTCPYRDSLYSTLTVDPATLTVTLKGKASVWVGKSPAELGYREMPSLTVGEEIVPAISDRHIEKIKKS